MISCPASRDQRHDAMIRLFQDTIEVLLLKHLPPAIADRVRPPAERAWLEDLSTLTGLPAATGIAGIAESGAREPIPAFPFVPSPRGMAELRAAHREARRELKGAATPAAAADARRVLAVLAAIGRALKGAGLWPAYVAAARAAAGRTKP